MDKTLSIKEAAEQATSTLNKEATEEATPEVAEVEVDGTEEAEAETVEGDTPEETEEPKAETKENKTDDAETDFEHIDPKTLPKELQAVYKNLLKGFTKGRQKDSERAKKAEEELERLRAESKKPEEVPQFKTKEEYWTYIGEQKAREAIKQEKEKEYEDKARADYPKLDPRLDDSEENVAAGVYDKKFDQAVGAELDTQLAEHIRKTGSQVGFDYKSAFENFKAEWDEYVTGNVKKYISKQGEIAKKSEQKLRKAAPKTTPGQVAPSGIHSVRDAMNAARETLNK